MKTVKFILIIFAATLVSCKKSNNGASTGPDKISVNIDGVKSAFNNSAKAVLSYVATGYLLQVAGVKGVVAKSDVIFLSVGGPNPIKVGTYFASYDGSSDIVSISYTQMPGPGFSYQSHLTTLNPATVTITSITDSTITGTFNGYVYQKGDSTLPKKNLIDGQFNVTF